MRVLFAAILTFCFYADVRAQEDSEDCDAFKSVEGQYLCKINRNLSLLNKKNEEILSVLKSMNGDERKTYKVKSDNNFSEPLSF